MTAVPLGQGSNPGEDMDVCKCIVPSRHVGNLNSCRAASPFVRLVVGKEWWEVPGHSQGVLSQNWGPQNIGRVVYFVECVCRFSFNTSLVNRHLLYFEAHIKA
ncbi:uncharacterized protein TNCV_88421 [Trichonephila clavipes]|nr:uncharacterized protein TNCV_88421 [Trichonephila clavipes]